MKKLVGRRKRLDYEERKMEFWLCKLGTEIVVDHNEGDEDGNCVSCEVDTHDQVRLSFSNERVIQLADNGVKE